MPERQYTLPASTAQQVLEAVDTLTARGRIVARPIIAQETGLGERTIRRAVTALVAEGQLEEPRFGILRRPTVVTVAAKSEKSANLAATAAADPPVPTPVDRIIDALNANAQLERAVLAAGRAPLGLRRRHANQA
jgi:hypothetical protein